MLARYLKQLLALQNLDKSLSSRKNDTTLFYMTQLSVLFYKPDKLSFAETYEIIAVRNR